MKGLSKKKREILERRETLLDLARQMLFERGYHGLTMARLAEAIDHSKATVYQQFSCKEEIIIALACRSVDAQRALVERAATFQGHTRERMVAVGEATELFAHLNRDDARLFQLINAEAITQKAPPQSLWPLKSSAMRTVGILNGIIRDAVAQGDVVLDPQTRPEELTFYLWLLGESSKGTESIWLHPTEMGVSNPYALMFRMGNVVGDWYGWRPLSWEWDYEETRRRVRREIFPRESAKVYGPEEVGKPSS